MDDDADMMMILTAPPEN